MLGGGFSSLVAACAFMYLGVPEALHENSRLPQNYKVRTKITNGCLSQLYTKIGLGSSLPGVVSRQRYRQNLRNALTRSG
jgi:hypothetical protein